MVSTDQTLAILDYMKNNPQLADSRFSRCKEGRNLFKRHWAACADLANNVSTDCAQRTPDQWRAYYNAYKSKLKKKIRYMKAESLASGDSVKRRLTDTENRLYSILMLDLGEDTPVSRLETEHQPSSSTAEVMEQDESTFINNSGSESSDIALHYSEDETSQDDDPIKLTVQLTSRARTDQQLKPVVNTDRQLKPNVHSSQLREVVVCLGQRVNRIAPSRQQLEPVIHNDQRPEPVVHLGQQLKPVVHSDQHGEPVIRSDEHGEPAMRSDQHKEPAMRSDQHKEPLIRLYQHGEPVIRSDQHGEPAIHSDQHEEPFIRLGQHGEPANHSGQRLDPGVNSIQQPESVAHSDQQSEPVSYSGQLKRKNKAESRRRLRHCPSSEKNGGYCPLNETTEALLNMERMKTEAKQEHNAAINRLAGAIEAVAERLGESIRLHMPDPPRAQRRRARIYSSDSE